MWRKYFGRYVFRGVFAKCKELIEIYWSIYVSEFVFETVLLKNLDILLIVIHNVVG